MLRNILGFSKRFEHALKKHLKACSDFVSLRDDCHWLDAKSGSCATTTTGARYNEHQYR